MVRNQRMSAKQIVVFGGGFAGIHTEGWDRQVVATGAAAKKTKQIINCQRICLPLNRNRHDILAAAAPTVDRLCRSA
jgi:hypothetical protein